MERRFIMEEREEMDNIEEFEEIDEWEEDKPFTHDRHRSCLVWDEDDVTIWDERILYARTDTLPPTNNRLRRSRS